MHPDFEVVIGLEVHCQLATDSKIFCCTKARLEAGQSVADEVVNQNTCPVCAGHPGSLPVLNRKAVEYAIRLGLATNSQIQSKSVFSRKHYFYPDLPKGFQISQFDLPICTNGYLDVEDRKVQIQRIHLEEDAGKNVHMAGYALVNLNRAGVPLVEIVTAPDLRSPEEAGAYLRTLHALVTYLEVSDGNMQEGNFRCDANVSVRKRGATEYGTRTETKNLNSFRFLEKAIEYESNRQIEIIKAGGRVVQETRGYDSAQNKTFSMRSKEDAHDYRYFPDPDLPPLVLEASWIESIRKKIPELPHQKKSRFMGELGLSDYDATQLVGSKNLAEFFEACILQLQKLGIRKKEGFKAIANLILGESARFTAGFGKVTSGQMVELVQLLLDSTLSSVGAKTILGELWENGGSVQDLVDARGLRQVNDLTSLEPIVDEVLLNNPSQVAEFKSGKDKLIGFLVGQIMKKSGGKANPALIQEMIRKKIFGAP